MRGPQQTRSMPAASSIRRDAGITLIELLVTIAILAILAAFAYPQMRNMIRHNRAASLSNSMQADLLYARGQAAATRSYISICPVANPGDQTCATNSGTYDNGWLVYTSSAANTVYDGTAANLRRVGQAAVNASLRSSINGVITYNSRGMLLSSGDQQATSDVLFYACSKTSATDTVGVSANGTPGVSLSAAGSGRVASFALAAGASCTPPTGT